MNPRSFLASLALPLATLAIGCATADPAEDDIASTQQALSTALFEMPQNGYPPAGLAPNYPVLSNIWLYPLTNAGIAATLATPVATGSSVLVSSLFNDPESPMSAEYLMDEIASCALDLGHDVSATFNTTIGARTRTWKGRFGLCGKNSPFGDWQNSPSASPTCRQMVSACILARMNALGKHVPISIRVPDKIAGSLVDTKRFDPVKRVRVQTMKRNGAPVASGWQPDFVGICTRGTTVTLQRQTAVLGQDVLVCSGIQACEPDPNYQEPIVPGSPRIYSGFLGKFAPGTSTTSTPTISFTCPTNAATAPNGRSERAYFSILVSPGTGAPSAEPMFMPISSPTTSYPAPERDVFTYVEGGFWGDLLPSLGSIITNACYSPIWQAGTMHEIGRMCAGDSRACGITSVPCDPGCARSPAPAEAYYIFPEGGKIDGVTVFLNDPTVISPDACASSPDSGASAIESGHDVCTPGAPMVNDGTNGVVTSVCTADPYCCTAVWDSRCINEVQTVAGSQACGTVHCSHSVCTPDAPLASQCSPVVASVCTVDSYCCNTAWDNVCVSEVKTVANSQACDCSHVDSTTGAALTNGCSPAVTSVCTADPYCCNTAWDSTCVQEVKTGANSQECGCSHPVCTPGAGLISGCSPVVTSVCTVDPYCCSTTWDGICVQEVQTIANSQECIPT